MRAGAGLLICWMVCITFGSGFAWIRPAGAVGVRKRQPVPDSTMCARLRQAREVRVCRLKPPGLDRCGTNPGTDSCVVGYPIRGWRPVPDTAWVGRMVSRLASEDTYGPGREQRGAGDPLPEIGVQFRGPIGVTDLVLGFADGRLVMASAAARNRTTDHKFIGWFGGARAELVRLAKQAFPEDREIQAWLDAAPPPPEPVKEESHGRDDLPGSGQYVYRDDEPALLRSVPAKYPASARASGRGARVTVNVLVAEDGRVRKWEIASGDPEFNDAAVEAVKQYEFKPAMANGHPVAVWVAVPITFPGR
jgi:TonB family protein